MTYRLLLAALLGASAAPLFAQAAPAPAAEAPKDDLVRVALDTSAGRIVIAVDRGHAPVTAKNFLSYVDSGKFVGESFYRAMPLTGGGLIQAGITSDARKLGKAIAHEPPSQTGLSHVRGAVSMASNAPGTAQSDFFILTVDVPSFDQSFAPFGRVVEGMDVVEKIMASPVSPTKGEGAMKGQMLEPVVKIRAAKRLP
ncbi:peptidylprolyl isomerase [Sphingomonas piscis]|uniref:Peptidyl-prolyl cis-trans isomerase n=1 Tax=Sphingomonas piscis TaxID=2714943 RepID=A0A6G7YQ77_9SPHN|nr:peptidylprolyl isomerase [Sphingomonas piscis]QIK78886.1 peptidylprolyl isomerase [Sphingomonas piscis]